MLNLLTVISPSSFKKKLAGSKTSSFSTTKSTHTSKTSRGTSQPIITTHGSGGQSSTGGNRSTEKSLKELKQCSVNDKRVNLTGTIVTGGENLVALDTVLLHVALAEIQTDTRLHNIHKFEIVRQQLRQVGPIVKAPSTNLPTSFDDFLSRPVLPGRNYWCPTNRDGGFPRGSTDMGKKGLKQLYVICIVDANKDKRTHVVQTDVKNLQTTRLLREEYTLEQAKAYADRYAAVLNRWPGLDSSILSSGSSKAKDLLKNVVLRSLDFAERYPAVSRHQDKKLKRLSYHVKDVPYWADYKRATMTLKVFVGDVNEELSIPELPERAVFALQDSALDDPIASNVAVKDRPDHERTIHLLKYLTMTLYGRVYVATAAAQVHIGSLQEQYTKEKAVNFGSCGVVTLPPDID